MAQHAYLEEPFSSAVWRATPTGNTGPRALWVTLLFGASRVKPNTLGFFGESLDAVVRVLDPNLFSTAARAAFDQEQERLYPGFIARTQVANATRLAQLAGVRFSRHDAQAFPY